jgi:hypothetical protein
MNKEKTVPTTAENPTSNVRSYFTKEVNDMMQSMSLSEMESVMKNMIDTQQWIALLKYTALRTTYLDATLRGTNPTTDPHTISWAQGALAGLCDIEGYVIELNATKPAAVAEEEPNEIRGEGVL